MSDRILLMSAEADFAEILRLSREMLFAFLASGFTNNAEAYADPEIRRIGEELDSHGAPERGVQVMAMTCMYLLDELREVIERTPGARAPRLIRDYHEHYKAVSQAPPELVLGCFQMLHAAQRRDLEMGLEVSRALVERYHADSMYVLALLCKDVASDIAERDGARDARRVLSDMALQQERDVLGS